MWLGQLAGWSCHSQGGWEWEQESGRGLMYWTCLGRGCERSCESAVLERSQDWRCLCPLAWMRQKGGSGDREETNGARCKPYIHEEGPAETRAIRKSIRQCGVMEATRKDKLGWRRICGHVWGPQGTQWEPRKRCAGVLATEGAPSGWGVAYSAWARRNKTAPIIGQDD